MPSFPNIKGSALAVYYPQPDTPLNGFSIPRLRDLLHDRMMERFAPEDSVTLDGDITAVERWGWTYPDGRNNPLHAHHYVAWGTRTWEKKISGSLKKAMCQQRAQEIREEDPKIPEKVLTARIKEYADEVTKRLQRDTPPQVAEDVVIWDDEYRRLIVFQASASKREDLVGRIERILEGMYSTPGSLTEVNLTEVNLTAHLSRSRPEAYMPANLAERFWTWLLAHASADDSEVLAVPVGDQTHYYTIAVSDKLKTREDEVEYKTANEVASYLQRIKEDEGMVLPSEIRVLIGDDPDAPYRWELTLTSDAQIKRCKLLATTDTDLYGDYEGMALVRADAFAAAYDVLHLLISTFDAGHLVEILEAEPQTGLFPLESRTGGHWMSQKDWAATCRPEPEPEETPMDKAWKAKSKSRDGKAAKSAERAARHLAQDLKGAGVDTLTLTTPTGSKTVQI